MRLVQEGGSSTSGPAALQEDVEEGAPVKKLVAPPAPTADDRKEHVASGHAVFRTRCRECCIGRGRMDQHRAGGRETAIPAITIAHGYFNDRDDQLHETAAVITPKESAATALKLAGVTVTTEESAVYDSQSNGGWHRAV